MTFEHQKSVPHSSVGETETVLGKIALSDIKIPAGKTPLLDKNLQLNKVEVEPGGTVAFHSHLERPAIMYIAEGEIIEYNSTHEKPIIHKVGSVSIEYNDVSHWWKNETDKKVVIFSAMLKNA